MVSERREYSTSQYEDIFPLEYSMQLTVTQNSSNTSSIEEDHNNWAAMAVIPIIAFVAMGNILVIMAVKMDHKLRSSTNYFLTSLAVADLLVAITVMPPSLAMIINNYAWPFPKGMCGIWVMLDVCFSTSSILHLCMISLDRYLALANPFRYNNGGWLSKTSSSGGWGTDKKGNSKWRMGPGAGGASKMTKRVAKRIFLVWAISIGIALPVPILASQDEKHLFNDEMCTINIPQFALCGSFVAFFFPLIVMFITYSLTIRTLQRQSKLVASMMGKDRPTHKGRLSSSSSVVSNSRRSYRKGSRKSIGSTKGASGKWTSGPTENSSLPEPDILYSIETEQSNEELFTMNHQRKDSSSSGINFTVKSSDSRIKTCARCVLRKMLCCDCYKKKSNIQSKTTNEPMESEFNASGSRITLRKSDSDSSDSSSMINQPPVKRSPMFTRANQTFAKAVSKLPLKRVSTRRISASMKSRAIAIEQRASKVLGMIFTLFCLFWCPFFITNVFVGFCELGLLHTCDMELMGNLMNWFVWVGYVSSGVNPCVYTLFSKQFRDTFRKLILRQYDQIGHRQFSRSFHQDRTTGGVSTSSFQTRDFQQSMDQHDLLRTENSRASGSTVYRSLGESVVRRQHKRNQISKSVDTAILSNSRKNSALADIAAEEDLKMQWRTTWHSDNGGKNHTDSSKIDGYDTLQQENTETNSRKKSTVKFADESLQCRRYNKRLMSEPNPATNKWIRYEISNRQDSNYIQASPVEKQQQSSPSLKSSLTSPPIKTKISPFLHKSVAHRRRHSLIEDTRYCAIKEDYNGNKSSSDESEYENNNADDVFKIEDISEHKEVGFTTSPGSHISVKDFQMRTKSNCTSCETNKHKLDCRHTHKSFNSFEIEQTSNLTKTKSNFYNNSHKNQSKTEARSNTLQRNHELEQCCSFPLMRLDSGMGESVRNSQSS